MNGIALAQLPEFTIDVPDGASYGFGYRSAIDGDYAVVSDPNQEIDGQDHRGAAYVYKRNGSSWELEQKLTVPNSDLNQYMYFAWSVDIDGNSIVVGAYCNATGGGSQNNLEGAAFVFVRDGTTWSQQGRLVQTNPQMTSGSSSSNKNNFGESVAISGDYVIIGARLDDGNGTSPNNKDRQGAAVIFVRSGTTWSEQQEIFANDPASVDYFGNDVDIDGDYAIVGAPFDDDGSSATGSAYIFKRSGTSWNQEAKINAFSGGPYTYSSPLGGTFFGASVAIDGDYAVVARGQLQNQWSTNYSYAYVFKRDNTDWNGEDTFETGGGYVLGGSSVDIDGDNLVVAGSEHVITVRRTGTDWNQSAKVKKDVHSVSISGDYVIGSKNNTITNIWNNSYPTITSVALAADNSTIAVTLSEAVYSTSGGSGNLEASDFVFSMSGGWANLTSTTPTSISASGNVYTLGIGLSGVVNNNEVLTVEAAENAIYNAAGNPVLTNQISNSVNLNETTLALADSTVGSPGGYYPSLLKIAEDTYVLAVGSSIITYTIPDDGSPITEVTKAINPSGITGLSEFQSLINVSGNTYALASTQSYSAGRKSYITTFTIPEDGSSITNIASLEHDSQNSGQANNKLLKLYDNTYVLAYKSGGNTGYLKTFTIPTDGSSITEVDSLIMFTSSSSQSTTKGLIKIDNNTFFGRGITYSISSDGSVIEKVKGHGISYNSDHSTLAFVHVEGDIYAVVGRNKVYTFNISADGSAATTVAELDYTQITGNAEMAPSLLKLTSNIYVIYYSLRSGNHSSSWKWAGHIQLIEISADGKTITTAGNLQFEPYLKYNSNTTGSSVVKIDANTFAISRRNNRSNIKTFNVNYIDNRAPTMSIIGSSRDNSSVDIRFSEEVYNTSGASGNLEVSDFSFSISGGTASLTSDIPSSISKIDAVTWRLGLNISGGGTANGEEILTVSPTSSSIYDEAGNGASSSTDGYLTDNTAPIFTDVTIENDGNKTVNITFSDKVYDTIVETGDLEESDFVFSISGGTASLNSTTPTSISGSGKTWSLGVDVSGTADGYEVLTVNPTENAIFDRGGNAASTTQTNNTANLKADKVGTSSAVLIEANSTYYHSLVQMNVLNYVVAYRGAQTHGHIKTFATSADGSSITNEATIEHDNNRGYHNSLVKIDDDTYALAYQGYNQQSYPRDIAYIKTFTIPADGSAITKVDSLQHDVYGAHHSFVKVDDDTYALAYNGGHKVVGNTNYSGDPYIKTFNISADGSSITEVALLKHEGDLATADKANKSAYYNSLIKMNDNTFLLAYYSLLPGGWSVTTGTGKLKTFTISSDGLTITQVDSLEYDSDRAEYNSLVKVDDDTYALAYDNGDGVVATFSISADGSNITKVSSLVHDTDKTYDNSFIQMNDDNYALAYAGMGSDGYLSTFTINSDGSSIKKVWNDEHDENYGRGNSMVKVNDATYLLAYMGTGSSYIKSFNIASGNMSPSISSSPTVTTNEDTEHAFSVSDFNYSDPDNDNLDHIKLISTETVGTLYLDADDDDTYDSGEDVISNQQIPISNITNGHLRFAPIANASGDAYSTFTYKVNDGNGYSGVTGTMTIKVVAINDVPIATAQTVSADEDIDETITLAGSDLETDTLTYIISTLPANGTLHQTSDGIVRTGNITSVPTTITDSKNRVIYRSAVDGNGQDHGNFGFKANDGESNSEEVIVVVNVVSVSDDISSVAQTISAAEDMDKTITLKASDVEGRALAYKISTLPLNGYLFQTTDGKTRGDSILSVPTNVTSDSAQVIFSSALNEYGNNYGNFGFRSFSGSAISSEAIVSINVAAVNDQPIAKAQLESAVEDEYELIILFGSDVENDSLTFIISTLPAKGTLFQTPDGLSTGDIILTVPTKITDTNHRVIYISEKDGNGIGHGNFGFKINDGNDESEEAIINLNVEAVNDRPKAEPLTISGDENLEEIITLRGSDVDGDAISFMITTLPANGSLFQTNTDSSRGNTITTEETNITDALGRVLYISAENEGGKDHGNFGYVVSDGTLESTEATVTVNIVEVDNNITVASQNLMTNEDSYQPITLSATDTEGRNLTYGISSIPIKGWLFQTSDTSAVGDTILTPTTVTNDSGKVIYLPELNGYGEGYGNFSFRAYTGESISSEGTVIIDVLSVNDAPAVDSLSFNIAENIPIGTQLDTLTAFDVDTDNSLLKDWTIIDGDSTEHFILNDTTGILSTNAILNFEETPIYTISVNVSDNFDTSPTQKILIQLTDIEEGILIDKEGGIVTSEYGESDTFTVVLQSPPFDTVNVKLSSSDSTEAFLSLDSLIFPPELWSTPQIVTITGIEDSINDPNISYSIILDSTLSSDPNYNGLDIPDLTAINMARDVYGPTVELFSSPDLIVSGNPFTVKFSITDNNAVEKALAYFALGGETKFDQLIMAQFEDEEYQVTIPSIAITYKGISYYVLANDSLGNESKSDIFSVNVKFDEGDLSTNIEGSVLEDSLPRNKWRMISIPAALEEENIETILEPVLGEKKIDSWVIKYWDGSSFTEPEDFVEGMGYWFIHDVNAPTVFKTGVGTSPDQSGFTFQFEPGWNMIGNPYPFTTEFELNDSLFSGPMTYGWSLEGWSDETELQPWGGYAVFNKSDSMETVLLKPVAISTPLYREIEPEPDGWELRISASGETYMDPNNSIGRISGSLEQYDFRDNPEPPYLGGYVSLIMPRDDWKNNISQFSSDIRSLDEENGVWDIELRVKEETGAVSLSLLMEGVFPVEQDIVLLDMLTREIHSLEEITSIIFKQNWGKLPVYPFKIIAGTPQYVIAKTEEILSLLPEDFALHQNYPNPFNPTTTIKFDIPEPTYISLKIYNLMGQEVRSLNNKWLPTGSHRLIWNGKDQQGIPVSTGVYIYRLQSQEFQQTRKMLLLK